MYDTDAGKQSRHGQSVLLRAPLRRDRWQVQPVVLLSPANEETLLVIVYHHHYVLDRALIPWSSLRRG